MVELQKRKIRWAISLFLMMLYFSGLPAEAQYGGGSGEPNDPYLIYTAEQMNEIGADANDWDKHFKLMADIDLAGYTGTDFNIIGNQAFPFAGVFDGNGKKILNFNYTSTPTDNIGLFGYVFGANAQIKDLGLIDPNVDLGLGGREIGSLVGKLKEGTVANCYVEAATISGGSSVGGLVGSNSGTITNCTSSAGISARTRNSIGGLVGYNSGTIINCTSSASIPGGYYYVGGLVGYNNGGRIIECNSSGELGGAHWCTGGLVGGNWNSGVISNCYSSSDVSGDHHPGGLVGGNMDDGIISNCYSTGSVSGRGGGSGLVGLNSGIISNCYSTGSAKCGLVGENSGTISNCYSVGSVSGVDYVVGLVRENSGTVTGSFWDVQTSGQTTSAGGTGIPTAEMQTQSTFTDAGWDFVDIWDICEGTNYPRLQWQIPAGDVVCPDGVSMVDFSFFAEHWLEETCDLGNDYCRGTDLDQSGKVDVADLGIFVDNWLAGIAFPAEPCPIEFSLLAHWKLDETEGSIAHDSAGDNDGIVAGDLLWLPADGKVDGALELDGIYDFVISRFAMNPAYGLFKVLAWIKGGAPGQTIICQTDGTGTGSAWLWASASDGRLMTSLMYPEAPLESESVITDGDWHQIGLMWDEWYRHLYVDGAEVAKDTHIVDPVSADGVLLFGAEKHLDAASFWSGLIDDILIYEGKYSP